MALLSPLEVILFFDGCIRPPNWKMIVCVEPHLGLFFRRARVRIPLLQTPSAVRQLVKNVRALAT